MRTLELFAGIGGLHAACPWLSYEMAIDINRDSQLVYAKNFTSPYRIRELETVCSKELESYRCELWWMSPPCTPFTRKGNRGDLEDPRSRAFLHLIQCVCDVRPAIVAVENVAGFETSQAYQAMASYWTAAGYTLATFAQCPSNIGWPNRRPRIYVLATLGASPTVQFQTLSAPPLPHLLERSIRDSQHAQLEVPSAILNRFAKAIDIVEADDVAAVSACFGSAYGKSITQSGSYLSTQEGLRRFTPREVANLLGFPADFILPDTLSYRRQWQLLGNSLSLPVVAQLLEFTRPHGNP